MPQESMYAIVVATVAIGGFGVILAFADHLTRYARSTWQSQRGESQH